MIKDHNPHAHGQRPWQRIFNTLSIGMLPTLLHCVHRCPDEADAQSLRAAVLLDELDRPAGRRAQIVVEVRPKMPMLKTIFTRPACAPGAPDEASLNC